MRLLIVNLFYMYLISQNQLFLDYNQSLIRDFKALNPCVQYSFCVNIIFRLSIVEIFYKPIVHSIFYVIQYDQIINLI
jgi:hypothetical protein